jgi:Zn-finger nucleic acid-binding protein
MKCPRCLNNLHLLKYSMKKTYHCLSCDGLFINTKQLDRLKFNSLFLKINEIKDKTANRLNLKCSNCNKPFLQFSYPFDGNNLILDFCNNCEYLWLDNEEKYFLSSKEKSRGYIDPSKNSQKKADLNQNFEREFIKSIQIKNNDSNRKILIKSRSFNIYKIITISSLLILATLLIFLLNYQDPIDSFQSLISRSGANYKGYRSLPIKAFFYQTSFLNLIYTSFFFLTFTYLLRKIFKTIEFIAIIFCSQYFGFFFVSNQIEIQSLSGNLPTVSSLIAFYSAYFSLDSLCLFLKNKLRWLPPIITIFINPKIYSIIWFISISIISFITSQKEILSLSIGGAIAGIFFGYLKFNDILEKFIYYK